MESAKDSLDVPKSLGHRRLPSVGKAMPVTSLLLNFSPSGEGSVRSSHMRGGEQEAPPIYFTIDEPSSPVAPNDYACDDDDDDDDNSSEGASMEQAYELLVSECSSADDGEGNGRRPEEDIALVGNSIFYTPCLTCTGNAPAEFASHCSALNEMCRRLCTDECRLRLSLAGFEPPPQAALRSKDALTDFVRETIVQRPTLQHTYSEDTLKAFPLVTQQRRKSVETPPLPPAPPPPSRIDIQRKQFLYEMISSGQQNDSDSDAVVLLPTEAEQSDLYQIVASIVGHNTDNTNNTDNTDNESNSSNSSSSDDAAIDAHELDMLKDFREKFAIAEALAKTSEMTSTTQIKQRLAARKLEMERENTIDDNESCNENHNNNNSNYNDNENDEYQPISSINAVTVGTHTSGVLQWPEMGAAAHRTAATASPAATAAFKHNKCNCINVSSSAVLAAASVSGSNSNTLCECGCGCGCGCGGGRCEGEGEGDNGAVINSTNSIAALADVVTATKQTQGNDFEPPRDLLLYLVRMGSFNSAPKINNVDSQDDELEIPKGLNTGELLQHVKQLRGEHQPPLLTRSFLKSSLTTTQMVANDVTDGLRCLKLNSMSRACSAPTSSPNHIRLLQWNILSQTLGQNNDGFVCCPKQALTWENRKFLIVQEILQHNPDIVCLQEVDHFKFLQNILGTQNYEGIFFPKPDSPCLYIEENNGPDGCAIFFKRDKFELKNYDKRVLEVWRVQSNQVAIAANLMIRGSGKELCVCTTHLKARHGSLLSKLRNEQGRDLIRFVKQIAGNRPVLLCGDFNAEPTEPVYTTMLNCDFLKLSSAYADIKATSKEECQINENIANDDDDNADDDADECDKAKKSMQHEPPYTTWKVREEGEECHTIDYVFYSQDELKVKNCLEFPQGEEIGKNRTPSFQYPSDHFSLVCDFEIMDKSQKTKNQ